jgi:epoxyqueuosine reductase
MVEALRAELAALGIPLYGFAEVGGVFSGPWAEWPRAISLALPLSEQDLAGVHLGPTPAYYAAYRELNARLNAAAQAVETWIKVQGYQAKAFPATVTQAELDSALGPDLTAPIQHKTVATRAGLGWIGKNALLVTLQYGPRVRLASVLTDLPLPTARPITRSFCGTCNLCVDACPADALRGSLWYAGMPVKELVDVRACRRTAEWLAYGRAKANETICGICIAVCPLKGRQRRKHL